MNAPDEGHDGEIAVAAEPAVRRDGLLRRTVAALVPRRQDLRGTVYLVLDHSTSMGDPGKMPQLQQGAMRFFLEAVPRGYAVGAIGFADRARLIGGAGVDAHRFWRRLRTLRPYGRTAMAAGLRMALFRLGWRGGNRVIVLITDGMPDDRESTLEAARLARARGVTLIPIGTGDADHAFLASLAGRPELARHVRREAFAGAIEAAAGHLATD